MLGLSRYQWAVLFAAWLGWGFDVFDGMLFNYVAPNCVPTLLQMLLQAVEGAETNGTLWVAICGAAARGVFPKATGSSSMAPSVRSSPWRPRASRMAA